MGPRLQMFDHHLWGLLKGSFTWDDHWGKPTEQLIFQPHGQTYTWSKLAGFLINPPQKKKTTKKNTKTKLYLWPLRGNVFTPPLHAPFLTTTPISRGRAVGVLRRRPHGSARHRALRAQQLLQQQAAVDLVIVHLESSSWVARLLELAPSHRTWNLKFGILLQQVKGNGLPGPPCQVPC